MKRYVKDNKIYELPIVLQNDGNKIYTNDQSLILANGYKEFVRPELTKEQRIHFSVARINRQTDKKILQGFVWKGNEFYLSMQNQQNFANMFVAKQFLTYPITVKTKTGFLELNDSDEVMDFYLSGVNYIKQCLEQGWKKKAEEQEKIRNS